MSYGYIYKTTNLDNGRIYIGQSKGSFSPYYLGSGKILKKAIDKYGRNNFKLEVISYASDVKILNSLEIKNISEYREVFGKEFLYNILDGGRGHSGPRTEETKSKISLANKGRKLSEEHKNKLSEAKKGKTHKPHSKETKEKLRQSHFRHKSDCKCGVCKQRRGEGFNHKIYCKCSHCRSIRGEIVWSNETNKKRSQSLMGHEFFGKKRIQEKSVRVGQNTT